MLRNGPNPRPALSLAWPGRPLFEPVRGGTCLIWCGQFATELAGKTASLDSDPHFWMPLTLKQPDYVAVMTKKGATADEATDAGGGADASTAAADATREDGVADSLPAHVREMLPAVLHAYVEAQYLYREG